MRKYFPQDKNYILYGAQFDQKEELLTYLVEQSKRFYQLQYNPLGLLDDTILKIQSHHKVEIEIFDEFYETIAAVYRFKFGNNQLEFLFDGMDHFSKYTFEWNQVFRQYIIELFAYGPFLKTVLQLCVFGIQGHGKTLAINRLTQYIQQHFDLKVYRYKGIVTNAA